MAQCQRCLEDGGKPWDVPSLALRKDLAVWPLTGKMVLCQGCYDMQKITEALVSLSKRIDKLEGLEEVEP